MYTMGLEDKIGTGKKALGYVIPFLGKYDPIHEAAILYHDKEIRKLDITPTEISDCLQDTYKENKRLMTYAKLADSTDKITSLLGGAAKIAGIQFGFLPGIIVHLGEEGLEMLGKAPFLYSVKNDNKKFWGLLTKEALTASVPVLGDLYDFFSNTYVTTTKVIIREKAKEKLISSPSVL